MFKKLIQKINLKTMRLNPKIKDFQKREMPINYSNLQVNTVGDIEERKSKLNERVVSGYGVIWGSKNDYGEVFVKGCAAKSINDIGPESNSNYKLKFRDRHGKSCALFTKLIEDDIGLYFETAPLDNVPWADDLLTQIRSGTINNFSIGFKHCWDRIEWDEENDSMINLEIRLFEISAVDIPSDSETFAVRSSEEPEYLQEDIEDFILTLPKSKHLEARTIFTRCMLPVSEMPPIVKRKAQETDTPADTGIDYNYLISKLKKK